MISSCYFPFLKCLGSFSLPLEVNTISSKILSSQPQSKLAFWLCILTLTLTALPPTHLFDIMGPLFPIIHAGHKTFPADLLKGSLISVL